MMNLHLHIMIHLHLYIQVCLSILSTFCDICFFKTVFVEFSQPTYTVREGENVTITLTQSNYHSTSVTVTPISNSAIGMKITNPVHIILYG